VSQEAESLTDWVFDFNLDPFLEVEARLAQYDYGSDDAAAVEAGLAQTDGDRDPISVDYHRNALAEARSFLQWCVAKQKWLRANPLDGVEGKGKRRHGKPQLRIDESRRWTDKALEHAEQGEAGAVAAMMTLLMDLRASEIVSRVTRDVDDDGHVLWIPDAKTPAGKRTLEVPSVLVAYLQALVAGREPEERLFGQHWRDWVRKWVQHICREAGVPVITAHGMRGTHASLATERGVTAHAVAAALGHESPRTTQQSYTARSSVSKARQQKVLTVLDGGRR
jgi:integrase